PRAYFGTLRVSVEYRNRPAMAQTRGSLAHDRGRIQSHGGERNDSGGGCIQSHPLRDESSRHRIASQPSPTQLQLGARYDFCLLALTCPCPNSTPTQSNSSRYDVHPLPLQTPTTTATLPPASCGLASHLPISDTKDIRR